MITVTIIFCVLLITFLALILDALHQAVKTLYEIAKLNNKIRVEAWDIHDELSNISLDTSCINTNVDIIKLNMEVKK